MHPVCPKVRPPLIGSHTADDGVIPGMLQGNALSLQGFDDRFIIVETGGGLGDDVYLAQPISDKLCGLMSG